MSFLADKKQEHERACAAAIARGDTREAVFHAAKTAEFDYALAEQTKGTALHARYIEDAAGWLEIGERLKTRPLRRKGGPSGTAAASRDRQTDQGGGDDEDEAWLVAEKPSVTFGMIIGMEDAKAAVMDMVVHPLKHPGKARALGLKPGGGVLLYGPPGNGKTLLGKAIANELDAPFYYASGAQIRSKWHGESEQRLRSLITTARRQPVAILFFDEVEGLLPRRGGNSVVDNRIVTQFLADIGGFADSDNTLLLLGATNCPWDIDDAVFRTGRFDEKIYIGLPDTAARAGILRLNIGDTPLAGDVDLDALAGELDDYTGSDVAGLVNAAKRIALRRSIQTEAEPTLTAADLQTARNSVTPSVNSRLMERYSKFKATRI